MSVERARILRRNATEAERRLWAQLRQLHAEGYHFRRQVQIGPYYADFASHRDRLIIELDGSHHFGAQRERDQVRDAFLRRAGYRVLRFANTEVMANLEGVGRAICDEMARPRERARTTRHLHKASSRSI